MVKRIIDILAIIFIIVWHVFVLYVMYRCLQEGHDQEVIDLLNNMG